MSEQDDLSAIDGNALVTRLAVVKVRAAGDSHAVEGRLPAIQKDSDEMAAERSDTEAVIDECLVRLLAVDVGPERAADVPSTLPTLASTLPTPAEINALPERLRQWVHDLETRSDPAGDLRALRLTQDENRAMRAAFGLLGYLSQKYGFDVEFERDEFEKLAALGVKGASVP